MPKQNFSLATYPYLVTNICQFLKKNECLRLRFMNSKINKFMLSTNFIFLKLFSNSDYTKKLLNLYTEIQYSKQILNDGSEEVSINKNTMSSSYICFNFFKDYLNSNEKWSKVNYMNTMSLISEYSKYLHSVNSPYKNSMYFFVLDIAKCSIPYPLYVYVQKNDINNYALIIMQDELIQCNSKLTNDKHIFVNNLKNFRYKIVNALSDSHNYMFLIYTVNEKLTYYKIYNADTFCQCKHCMDSSNTLLTNIVINLHKFIKIIELNDSLFFIGISEDCKLILIKFVKVSTSNCGNIVWSIGKILKYDLIITCNLFYDDEIVIDISECSLSDIMITDIYINIYFCINNYLTMYEFKIDEFAELNLCTEFIPTFIITSLAKITYLIVRNNILSYICKNNIVFLVLSFEKKFRSNKYYDELKIYYNARQCNNNTFNLYTMYSVSIFKNLNNILWFDYINGTYIAICCKYIKLYTLNFIYLSNSYITQINISMKFCNADNEGTLFYCNDGNNKICIINNNYILSIWDIILNYKICEYNLFEYFDIETFEDHIESLVNNINELNKYNKFNDATKSTNNEEIIDNLIGNTIDNTYDSLLSSNEYSSNHKLVDAKNFWSQYRKNFRRTNKKVLAIKDKANLASEGNSNKINNKLYDEINTLTIKSGLTIEKFLSNQLATSIDISKKEKNIESLGNTINYIINNNRSLNYAGVNKYTVKSRKKVVSKLAMTTNSLTIWFDDNYCYHTYILS